MLAVISLTEKLMEIINLPMFQHVDIVYIMDMLLVINMVWYLFTDKGTMNVIVVFMKNPLLNRHTPCLKIGIRAIKRP